MSLPGCKEAGQDALQATELGLSHKSLSSSSTETENVLQLPFHTFAIGSMKFFVKVLIYAVCLGPMLPGPMGHSCKVLPESCASPG